MSWTHRIIRSGLSVLKNWPWGFCCWAQCCTGKDDSRVTFIKKNILQRVFWTNSDCFRFVPTEHGPGAEVKCLPEPFWLKSEWVFVIICSQENNMRWETWTVPNVTWTIIIFLLQWVFLLIVYRSVYTFVYMNCKCCFFLFLNDQPWDWDKCERPRV